MKERKAASWASRESREEGQEENRGTTRVSPEPQARKGRGIGQKEVGREGKLDEGRRERVGKEGDEDRNRVVGEWSRNRWARKKE